MIVRKGSTADAAVAAHLHATEIAEGFLPSLGQRFLTRLYQRIALDAGSVLVVAEEAGRIVGIAAATENLRRLYATFAIRDGWIAALTSAPRVVASWRKLMETMRYPSLHAQLPDAELLSVAVVRTEHGRGIGLELTRAALTELAERGVKSVRVVTSSDNHAALALYQRSGFARAATIRVHRNRDSEVLVWS